MKSSRHVLDVGVTLVGSEFCIARSYAFRLFSYRLLFVSSFTVWILKWPNKNDSYFKDFKKRSKSSNCWRNCVGLYVSGPYITQNHFISFVVVSHFNNWALDVANNFNWCIVKVISNIKRYATRASLCLFSRISFNRLIAFKFVVWHVIVHRHPCFCERYTSGFWSSDASKALSLSGW